MSLSEEDRELVAGFGGLLGPRHRERAVAAVELIVARQVAAALSEAAEAIEEHRAAEQREWRIGLAERESFVVAADIVRSRINH